MIVAIILSITFGTFLSIYLKPTKNVSLNLSLTSEDEGHVSEEYDNKGWTVYTQSHTDKTELIPNGFGGYTGIELGQTFYYSRVLEEELDNPTLQINVSIFTIAVFLDDTLIYTDCPELDNRIGYLTLPMNESNEDELIVISLPPDYQGKTLTIAQSMPDYYDTPTLMAVPCNIMLYSSFSYESELIAESFATAIQTTLAFAVGLVLLIIFVFNHNIGALCTSLVAFLWMTSILFETTFYNSYFRPTSYDISGICRMLSALVLLIFLITKASRYKKLMWGVVCIYIVSLIGYGAILYFAPETNNILLGFLRGLLSEWIISIAFLTILILGITSWRKENRFYRLFAPLTLTVVIIYWSILLITNPQEIQNIVLGLEGKQVTYIYFRLLTLFTICTLFSAIVETIQNEIDRRTENRLSKELHKMSLESYNNLRNHHQEVMMIRHDMNKHFHTLQKISNEETVKSYLTELIGQNEKIRPVVQSRNEILDIILNSKLTTAINSGVKLELIKTEAPKELPLSNADLCSLVMNIVDNAVTAAVNSNIEPPTIRLDMHIKNNFFAFSCENSTAVSKKNIDEKNEPIQKHGFGLKIIHDITKRYDGLINIEHTHNTYKINVIFPLC